VSSAGASVSENVLEVQAVDVRLSGRKILDRVSFNIAAGEFTGLIGSNGAGKTTLFRVILGLQAANTGSVTFGDPPRADGGRPGGHGFTGPGRHGRPRIRSRSRGHRQIGYVPQKFLLDPDLPLRARDLVGLGLDAQRLGVPRPSRARRALVEEMLEAVDATRFADTRVGRLSGGEQQRILIAHALIARPRLLLLDEPLANLDLRSAHEVVALLARIAREQQIAILISAHEINPLLGVMDRIVYLAAGRAVSGSTDEVVRADVLSKLYGHHVDVLNVHGRVLIVAGAGEDTDLAGHEVAFPDTEIVS
jgi:zinc/manganese transport system ATP-binding protein